MYRYVLIIGLIISFRCYSQSVDISKNWKLNIGDTSDWANVAYNDNHWKTAEEISPFEDNHFRDFKDFGWVRKKIVFPSDMKVAADKAGYFYLSLGKIYDADQVFFNGKLVGETGSIPPNKNIVVRTRRIYKIASENIQWDKENLIAVRIFSNFHNGGLQGEKCAVIFPSDNIFHLTEETIPGYPLSSSEQAYEALANVSSSYKEEVMKTGGLSLKLKLPKQASLFYNKKFIGATDRAGERSFFVPASLISKGNANKITVYINSKDALDYILFAAPEFSAIQGSGFNLMQVINYKIRKGSFNSNTPVTVSVNVLNTNTNFNGDLTLSLTTDINNVQQSESHTIHLNKLESREFDFTLKPNFTGVYHVEYILQNETGEKITGILAKGDKL